MRGIQLGKIGNQAPLKARVKEQRRLDAWRKREERKKRQNRPSEARNREYGQKETRATRSVQPGWTWAAERGENTKSPRARSINSTRGFSMAITQTPSL